MAQQLTQDDVSRLLIDANILDTRYHTPNTWAPLGREESNFIWKAQNTSGQDIVIRVPKKPRSRNATASETYNQRLAAAHDLGPHVLFSDSETGILVSDFLDGKTITPGDCAVPSIRRDILLAAKKLHKLPHTFQHTHSYLTGLRKRAQTYLDSTAPSLSLQVDQHTAYTYPLVEARIIQLTKLLEINRPANCPCHSDLVTHNIQQRKDGTIQFIDWELSGMGDPHEEVANFLWSATLSTSDLREALDVYFAPDDFFGRARTVLFLGIIPFDWVLRHGLKSLEPDLSLKARQSARKRQKRRFREVCDMLSLQSFARAQTYLEKRPKP
ncbi:hypothetical protein GCM10017044_06440 [Kordiimonas sediminis]|uniref:Aminoglycoside phosphotransferase domain-containing protein n=1 Tax=Kordiimonas sediminis TaxID=1735581 RepID=A0A919E5H6_9PROT|nr:phosphotransferase [Kordiimonas sediminis]GHF15005.1 hypothetical protein GCM10017044_06440 [Kordiimonas sediminis]